MSKVIDVVRKRKASAISGVRGVPMADDLQVGRAVVKLNRMFEFFGLRRIHSGDATALCEVALANLVPEDHADVSTTADAPADRNCRIVYSLVIGAEFCRLCNSPHARGIEQRTIQGRTQQLDYHCRLVNVAIRRGHVRRDHSRRRSRCTDRRRSGAGCAGVGYGAGYGVGGVSHGRLLVRLVLRCLFDLFDHAAKLVPGAHRIIAVVVGHRRKSR